jgi:hypothetical protein
VEQVPRDALAHQVHPYPPVNMYKSESYQFDVANGNTTDYNYFNYMVETFYIKSVVARLSCHIILLLPQPKNGTFMRTSINYNSNPISGKLDVPVTNYSCVGAPVDENDFIIPTPDVRASILKVLSDFKNFIAKTKHTWSPLQSYTFSMLYLTYKMAFSFIKHEYVYPVLAFYSIGSFRVELPPGLDLTDVETILRINENMDYIKQTVNETLEFFDNPENYQGLPTHIPHGVVLSALDICSQITMYMIRLDTYNYEARDQLDIILSILSKDKFWDTWEPVDITKKAISEFLLSNPLKFSSASPSTDSTSSSEQPFVLGITELDPMDPLALLDMQLASLPMHDFLSCVDSTTFFDGIQ